MKKAVISGIAWCFVLVSLYWTMIYVDWHTLQAAAYHFSQQGELVLLMSVGYAAAFWLRSLGWSLQMSSSRVAVCRLWYYHHIGLFLNHVLPVKGGEIARAALLKTREGFTWPEAVGSVGVSRLLDLLGLVFIACTGVIILLPDTGTNVLRGKLWVVAVPVLLLSSGVYAFFKLPWNRWAPQLVQKYPTLFEKPSWLALVATAAGWMLEAVVVFSVVYALGGQLGVGQALVVHVLTIIGQTFHITPGGIGTYETVMTALLHQIAGHSLGFALQVAIISHGFKFIYSFVVGAVASWQLQLSPLAFYRQASSYKRCAENVSGEDNK